MESPIEDMVVNRAEKDGWFVRKLIFQGRRNAPDRLFIKGGRVVFIEFKRPGKDARPGQSSEIGRMREAGAEVYVIDNPFRALKILGVSL